MSLRRCKTAFWVLLTTVVAFQIIISAFANARHEVFYQRFRSRGKTHQLAASNLTHSQVWQEVLSTSPKIIVLHNFATKEECRHLIQLGISQGMQSAKVLSYGGDEIVDSSFRTNTAAWLSYHQDAVVTRIENELARHTKTHPLDGEALQILHYGGGQMFNPHMDALVEGIDATENFIGGNRMLTGLLYLQNAEEGGETYFTKLDMRVKPDVGDVLLFWNTNSDGSIVLASEHAGSPPTKGDKWVATKWIRWGLYQTKDAELKGISPQQLSEERAGSVFS